MVRTVAAAAIAIVAYLLGFTALLLTYPGFWLILLAEKVSGKKQNWFGEAP